MEADKGERVPFGEDIRGRLNGFIETGQWESLVGFLTDLESLKLIAQEKGAFIGTTGFPIRGELSHYLDKIPEEIKSGNQKLSHISANLSSFSASLEMLYVRGCGMPDPEAVCKECGSKTIVHGHKDLGGVDYYDNYFAMCTSCFWAWHKEQYTSWGLSAPIYEFNYDTNTY